jgi:hypothetical protein
MQGLELTRRELISPVLILASLLAKSQVELRAEATVQGSLVCGPIDYTALIEQAQILLTEAKKAELKEAEGQVRQTSFVQGLLLNPDTDLRGNLFQHARFQKELLASTFSVELVRSLVCTICCVCSPKKSRFALIAHAAVRRDGSFSRGSREGHRPGHEEAQVCGVGRNPRRGKTLLFLSSAQLQASPALSLWQAPRQHL